MLRTILMALLGVVIISQTPESAITWDWIDDFEGTGGDDCGDGTTADVLTPGGTAVCNCTTGDCPIEGSESADVGATAADLLGTGDLNWGEATSLCLRFKMVLVSGATNAYGDLFWFCGTGSCIFSNAVGRFQIQAAADDFRVLSDNDVASTTIDASTACGGGTCDNIQICTLIDYDKANDDIQLFMNFGDGCDFPTTADYDAATGVANGAGTTAIDGFRFFGNTGFADMVALDDLQLALGERCE